MNEKKYCWKTKTIKRKRQKYLQYLLAITTLAPSWDNTFAMPFPRPVPPPVIRAVRPLKVPSGNIGLTRAGNIDDDDDILLTTETTVGNEYLQNLHLKFIIGFTN